MHSEADSMINCGLIELSDGAFVRADLTSGSWHEDDDDEMEYDEVVSSRTATGEPL